MQYGAEHKSGKDDAYAAAQAGSLPESLRQHERGEEPQKQNEGNGSTAERTSPRFPARHDC